MLLLWRKFEVTFDIIAPGSIHYATMPSGPLIFFFQDIPFGSEPERLHRSVMDPLTSGGPQRRFPLWDKLCYTLCGVRLSESLPVGCSWKLQIF